MREKKTSAEWVKPLEKKYDLEIHKPNGWYREDLNYSFSEEKITKNEFHRRLSESSVQMNKEAFKKLYHDLNHAGTHN